MQCEYICSVHSTLMTMESSMDTALDDAVFTCRSSNVGKLTVARKTPYMVNKIKIWWNKQLMAVSVIIVQH